MAKAEQSQLKSEDWFTLRDFVDDDKGYTLDRYEMKYVGDTERDYLEDDLVLLRVTNAQSGTEQLHHLPREAIETAAERLP